MIGRNCKEDLCRRTRRDSEEGRLPLRLRGRGRRLPRPEQELALGVVALPPAQGDLPPEDGVAEDASCGAGVVLADVDGLVAAALRPVAFQLGPDRPPSDGSQSAGVDAPGGLCTRNDVPSLGADGEAHPTGFRYLHQPGRQVKLRPVGGVGPGEAEIAGRQVEVSRRLPINLGEGDHHLVDGPFQRPGEALEVLDVKMRRRQGRENDRVVPPDGGPGPVGVGDGSDQLDRLGGAEGRGLELARIAGDGLLDDEGAAEIRYPRKPPHEGAEVSRPEDEAVDVLREEADAADLAAVVRIGDGAVSGLEPPLEPLAVEGGDVRSVTGGDDHLSHLAALLVVGAPLVGADVLAG